MGASAQVHIGTSGWHYDHWRRVFYPRDLAADRWLAYYAGRLHSTEVNNTFYRLPQTAVLSRWVADTPRDFVFAVKAWRVITHRKKLKDCADALKTFLDALKPLRARPGPILFQLPPHWHCNPQRLADFIALLPGDRRFAFEFRDRSWHCRDVYDVLRAHNAAFCIYDLDGFVTPLEVTAAFVYIRLHGPGGAYQGRYHGNSLRAWRRRIDAMARGGRDVYVYFDNDQAGYAVQNALALRKLIAGGER